MGGAARWAGRGLVAVLCALGCGGEQPPSYTTPLGIQVWVFGRAVPPEAVDAAALDTVEEFSDRYGREEARAVLTRVRISFLAEDAYLLEGQQVAGNTSSTGDRVYVGAGTLPLSRSALVHEWVHALDLQRTGDTDDSHASWEERIYPGIARVNARLARREE